MARHPNISRAARRTSKVVGVTMCLAAGSAEAHGTLTPPRGNVLLVSATGVGTQKYICSPAGGAGATSFKFTGPQSTLSVPLAGGLTIELADNILGAVPGKSTTPSPGCVKSADETQQYCPVWRSPLDQSAVFGTTVTSVTAGSGPSRPNAGDVSCLPLKSLATTGG